MLVLFFGAANEAKACHGVGVINPTFVNTGTSIIITATSDASTCGCGPYYLQAEVAFTSACFTGLSPSCGSASWNTYPWYFSLLDIPNYNAASGWVDNCVPEPYDTITIPFGDLCPGTSYVIRVREYVCGSLSPGGWSITYSFTTPGIPPAVTLVTTASQYDACPGDTVQLNATATGGCPGTLFTYAWSPTAGLSNPNIANPTLIVPSSNTVYTVTLTSGCGAPVPNTSDDTVGITIGPPPVAGTATASPPSVCSGQSSQIVLTGNNSNVIQWQVSPNAVTWFNLSGANNDTLSTGPLSSSLYYQAIVTGTGWPGTGCGSIVSPPVQVVVNPSPVADAGANTTVCSGSCTNLNGTGGVSYTWMPGNLNTQSINVCPASSTTYTVYVTDINGCSDSDMVTVNTSVAAVTASPDVAICTGNNTILVASGPNGNTYAWTPSGSLTGANTANPSANPSATTTYTVTATNQFGCTAMDSVTVTVTPAPPLSVSNDTTFCSGGTATLNASGATSYTWQPGNMSGSSITVNPASTTTYIVTGNNGNCVSSDTITVTVAPPPAVFAGPDFGVCQGTQVTLNVSTTGTSYTWQPAASIIGSNTAQSVVAAPTANTSYTVIVVGPGGCISSDTLNITVNPIPTVSATTTDNSICAGGSTTLNASGASAFAWIPTVGVQNPNQASTTANPTNTTTYQVVGTDANGCTDTASVTITVNPLPLVYLTATPSECGDSTGTIMFNGVVTGTGPFTYTINSQTVTMPVTNLITGNYTVVTTDNNGCVSSQVITVGFQNSANVTAVASPNFGVYPLPVNFGASGTSGLNNWFWDFGDAGATANTQNPSHTYTTPGTYMVILTAWNDLAVCAVVDTIYISVVEQAIIALPNVFTPNADGTNDGFSANLSGVKDISVEIYDRWGARVFEGTQSGLAGSPQVVELWNGDDKGGKVAADGVYYYVVTAIGYDGLSYPFSGFVQLMKAKP